jgi:hypothetical protein
MCLILPRNPWHPWMNRKWTKEGEGGKYNFYPV